MATPPTHKAASRRRPPARGRGRRAAAWLPVLLALTGLVAGCAPPAPGTAGGPGRLYALLDGERAAPAGPPLPAGEAPAQAAPGPDGSVLVLAFSRNRPAGLTHVARDRSGWRARPVPLGAPLRQAALAADGGRYAAVAHHLPDRRPPEAGPPGPPAGPCRLTLLDLAAGEARTLVTHPACAAGEHVTGLALGAGCREPGEKLKADGYPTQFLTDAQAFLIDGDQRRVICGAFPALAGGGEGRGGPGAEPRSPAG